MSYTFLDASSATQQAAADPIGGVQYPYVKIVDGTAGSQNLAVVTSAGYLQTILNAETTKVIGTVNISTGQSIGITGGISVTGGTSVTGVVTVGGVTALNISPTENPVYQGAIGITSEQAVVTTGHKVGFVADVTGKQIIMPFANKENFISGNISTTGNAGVSLISAQSSGIKIYVTNISIANTGTAATLVTLQNGSGGSAIWQTIAPAGGGSNISLAVPILTSAATALFITFATASSTAYCSVSGYIGT